MVYDNKMWVMGGYAPYGGSYTYSVSWTNGSYASGNSRGTFVYTLTRPGASVNIGTLFPSASRFTYSVPVSEGPVTWSLR